MFASRRAIRNSSLTVSKMTCAHRQELPGSCPTNLSSTKGHVHSEQRSSNPADVLVSALCLVLPSERCKLICKVSDDRLERSFVLGDRVEDGTPCGREEETRDICISGVCMPIGCDQKYPSNATEDVCGVCNGQNRTCKLVNGQRMVFDFGSSPSLVQRWHVRFLCS